MALIIIAIICFGTAFIEALRNRNRYQLIISGVMLIVNVSVLFIFFLYRG